MNMKYKFGIRFFSLSVTTTATFTFHCRGSAWNQLDSLIQIKTDLFEALKVTHLTSRPTLSSDPCFHGNSEWHLLTCGTKWHKGKNVTHSLCFNSNFVEQVMRCEGVFREQSNLYKICFCLGKRSGAWLTSLLQHWVLPNQGYILNTPF